VGPAANALHGADLAFYVGFLVTAALYLAMRKAAAHRGEPQRPASQR
jgi:hypothetical protein